jgi:hypothetical protein
VDSAVIAAVYLKPLLDGRLVEVMPKCGERDWRAPIDLGLMRRRGDLPSPLLYRSSLPPQIVLPILRSDGW